MSVYMCNMQGLPRQEQCHSCGRWHRRTRGLVVCCTAARTAADHLGDKTASRQACPSAQNYYFSLFMPIEPNGVTFTSRRYKAGCALSDADGCLIRTITSTASCTTHQTCDPCECAGPTPKLICKALNSPPLKSTTAAVANYMPFGCIYWN